VDASGNAAAHLEIAVPPGPHGVQPRLALAYSSAEKNGLLGVGWTLQGVSAITRVGPSKYYDGDELRRFWALLSEASTSRSPGARKGSAADAEVGAGAGAGVGNGAGAMAGLPGT
jgi:hypothetical protein